MVDTTEDARKILIAAVKGVIPILARPLHVDEQRHIHSGDIFIWEAKGLSAAPYGLDRFRDGHRWGPSRRRGDFLYYQELATPPPRNNSTRCM
ncbi:hypothetical protein B0H11DRAFT_1712447 [Mycena galericulata]|nr:hypothetical protein B0H11DRAFT_1712447 [Mycena galericulata]